jgi:hypothetical protein
MTRTHTNRPPTSPTDSPVEPAAAERPLVVRLVGRVTKAEWVVAGLVAAVMSALVVIEPDILEAPVENSRTIVFTLGGAVLAVAALALMLRFDVPPLVRILVLWVPFAAVSWWLLSPYFVDDVVDDEFSTSIAAQVDEGEAPTTAEPGDAAPGAAPDSAGSDAPAGGGAADDPADQPPDQPPAEPVLLGAGEFAGLAGHSGTGDAGVFENPDGSRVLRFENFDIENGPDLEVYWVPGADQTSPGDGSVHLGALKGNVGDQTYELPRGADLAPGEYTALVWCEAFTVEFVGATLTVS